MRPVALDEEINSAAYYKNLLRGFERKSIDTVEVVTPESKRIVLQVMDEGWKVIGSDADPYPTFEAALMELSPKFSQEWDDELDQKLNVVAEEQREEDLHEKNQNE